MTQKLAMHLGFVIAGVCCCLPATTWAADHCTSLLPANVAPENGGSVSPETLATLRDIGPPSRSSADRPVFSLSPDGHSIAFQIHQGDPSANRYCVGLVILNLEHPNDPKLVDIGHELLLDAPPRYGWASFPIGVPAPVTPRWAPNGKWVGYLKKTDAGAQIWRIDVATGDRRQISHADGDVDEFRISADGRVVIYALRPGFQHEEAAIDREGLSGWHYDERAFPVRGGRPQTPNSSRSFVALDIGSGHERPATKREIEYFESAYFPTGAGAEDAVSNLKMKGFSAAVDTSVYPADYRIAVETMKRKIFCPLDECQVDRAPLVWWTSDGHRLRFSRRDGWAKSLTTIYEWRPASRQVRRLYQTSDLLVECHPLDNDLICLRERSREPRRFVKLKLNQGREEIVFDPNPGFALLATGMIERLQWLNSYGIPFYGDLVYPVGFVVGRTYPLVVVQYRTKGFLRGGTGDEMPIQAFANQGYFVLVVDNLTYEDIVGKQMSATDLTIAFNRNFIGRKNILSAIEVAVRSLIDRGVVDIKRVGIAGISDGCSTVQYAALHSTLFSAGSVSGCGWEPMQDAFLGPMIAKSYHDSGWPRLVDKAQSFWSQISISSQAAKVRFPMLFQAADNEFLSMVTSHTALSQAKIPSELYIFPNEDHVKWQPAHRLAAYRRNLAWFGFWLGNQQSIQNSPQQDIARWEAMKAEWLPTQSGESPN